MLRPAINLQAALLCVLHIMMSAPAFGGVEGSLETTFQADNAYSKNRGLIDVWGDLLLKDKERESSYGFSFSAGWRDDRWDSEIYQLYAEKDISSSSTVFKGGRFERSDQTGYYTVDGVDLKKCMGIFSMSIYGGGLLRIEDAEYINGGSVSGLQLSFKDKSNGNIPDTLRNMQGVLGFQRIYDGSSITRITIELSKERTRIEYDKGYWKFNTGGSYIIEDDSVDTFLAAFALRPGKKTFFRIAYEIYDYNDEALTFRDRFYGLYAKGKEESLKSEFYYSTSNNLELYLIGQRVFHEDGGDGYDTTAGAVLKTKSGVSYTAETDYLYINGESAMTLLLSSSRAVDARTTVDLNVIHQIADKRTTGKNNLYGIEGVIERMISGNVFFSLYGMDFINDKTEDDYEIGIKLRWMFNEEKI